MDIDRTRSERRWPLVDLLVIAAVCVNAGQVLIRAYSAAPAPVAQAGPWYGMAAAYGGLCWVSSRVAGRWQWLARALFLLVGTACLMFMVQGEPLPAGPSMHWYDWFVLGACSALCGGLGRGSGAG
ncbi:hypothetical protein [Bordetella holmesii]|uniref:Uncharacterized protein n=2 Tax=Bordetella holmesii TaxID=35814 RepID=A0A158M756_9BORD|nr:hypothetical protein [Bordetella holmesii]AHV94915.1 putative membrane protein [Bordetella holmesii ATCC 51541]AIT25114.1 putative membrane protein [Bordetella holmesii 44057]EWM45677.1 putative membrane protein [Bordetella holmesii 70147]EWM48554.1 putative membrane protein [Bordetella holmesii 41130]EWM49801.1 putative membrane protein [Bordetella holmesii 35009]